jgi:hypothetical protein
MIKLRTKWLKLSLALGAVSIVFLSCNTTTPNAETTTQSLSQTSQLEATDTTDSTQLIVGDISELKNQTECNNLGDTLVYAETKNYFVYICGSKEDINQPTYFKAKPKTANIIYPTIIGKAVLGWQKVSFVGISGDFTYVFSIPSSKVDSKPFLYIHPYALFKQPTLLLPKSGQYEELTKYLSIVKLRQAKNLEVDSSLDNKKRDFVKYLLKNKKKLNVCEIPGRDRLEEDELRREVDSTLYDLGKNKYLLILRCNAYLKYNSFNLFLISGQNSHLNVRFLIQPEILKGRFGWTGRYEDRIFYGRPLYDPQTKTLTLHVQFSGIARAGNLMSFAIQNDKLELVELRHEEGNGNLYIDPILYNRLYP